MSRLSFWMIKYLSYYQNYHFHSATWLEWCRGENCLYGANQFAVLCKICDVSTNQSRWSRWLVVIVSIFTTAFSLSAQHKHKRKAQEKSRMDKSFQFQTNTVGRSELNSVFNTVESLLEQRGAVTPRLFFFGVKAPTLEDGRWCTGCPAIAALRPFDQAREVITPEK